MAEQEFSQHEKDNIARLISQKENSEADFEKNITYIAAGTLVLSLTFIEKIAPLEGAKSIWFLITSWICLILSLLSNLISHEISAKHSIKHIDNQIQRQPNEIIKKDIARTNYVMTTVNHITIGLLISGLAFLITYCSINAIKMSKIISNDKEVKILPQQPGEDKGRYTAPVMPVPQAVPQPAPTPTPSPKK